MHRRIIAILAALLCGAPTWTATAQPHLSLQRYTPDEGLSQHAITALAEDDHGLLWIGTQEGLNRFDGHHFEVRRNTPGDASGLVSSSIEALVVDARSRLWIGTNDAGLEVIDLRTRKRWRLGTDEGVGHPTVRTLLLDSAGGAWLGTASGIDHVAADLGGARSIGTTARVVAMAFDAAGVAHALDARCHLWRLDRTRIAAVTLTLPPDATCVAMQPDGQGFWLATARDGLHRVGADGGVTGHHAAAWLRPARAVLTAATRRRDGQWLLGYSDGAVMQAPADWRSAPARVEFDQPIESAITRFHEHRSGVLWIGSGTSGLFRARALPSTIRRDLVAEAAVHDWPSRSLRSIWRDGEALLIGTDAGLLLRQRADAPWRTVAAIGTTSVRVITPARQGGWWLGTHRGLWHLDTDARARAIPGLPDSRVTDILVEPGDDGGELLWIATRGGLARFHDGTFDNDGLPPQLDGQFLTSLMRDRRGRLWIGSNERGVFRIETDGSVQHLHGGEGRLPNDSIWSMHDGERAIWLGSFAGGLLRLDPDTDRVTAYTERDGLSNNVVYRIEPGARGRLWLTTNQGISVLDPASGIIQTINRGDGLFNREYNSGASFTADDGLLYLGGTDGLDILDPKQFSATSPHATPVITGLRVLGRRGQAGPMPMDAGAEVIYADRIELDYNDRVVQLDMVALDFTAPDASRLRYRIEDIHDDWIEPREPQTSVVLSYLPPGEYPLEVQAAGRDGRFASSRKLMLVMLPPPWRHPLAQAAYALLALALLGMLTLRQRAQWRAKQAQITRLNQTVAERTAALKQANHMLLRTNEQLELATRIDPLTQVSNRRDLKEWLDRERPQVIREIGLPGSGRMLLFMIDIDDFKRINDSHGHQVGDEVLVEVARRLRLVCRERDILVRWGGEEFLLLVRDAHLGDIGGLAERIRGNIADAPVAVANGQSLSITCSIGLAPWPLSPRWPSMGDWEQSVNLADQALYAAKAAGKNAWVGVVPGPKLDRPNLQSLLAGALPDELSPGSVEVVHSTATKPRLRRD